MSNHWNSRRNAVAIFAVALTVAVLAALITTLRSVDTRYTSNETHPGTIGLASRILHWIERRVRRYGIDSVQAPF